MQMWLANGAELAWLINPVRKTVEIFSARHAPQVLLEPEQIVGTGPVEGFHLQISQLWS